MRIILYQANQTKCGGVEQFNYTFCQRLSKYYDITFLCDTGDPAQLARIRKYVPVVIFDNQIFETDICIFSSAWGKRPVKNIIAKRYIQMVHADFRGLEKFWAFQYQKLDEVTEHLGGGQVIADTFKERFGWDCGIVHYMLDNTVEVQPVLHLITTSRIGKEKGFDRIVKMAKILKEREKKFTWDIWGDGYDQGYVNKIKRQLEGIPEVSFHGYGTDLYSYVSDSDYLVQLSDTEGYAFSIHEALSMNTPVIATDFPNAREQITDGKNGYIVDMELKCLDDGFIKKLYEKRPQFKFKEIGTEEEWFKVLGKPDGKKKKTVIKQAPKTMVQCIKTYTDILLGRKVLKGEIYEVSEDRFTILFGLNLIIKLEHYDNQQDGKVVSIKKG